jgi:uncharacterized protein YqeY
MTILERLERDMIEAAKAREKERLGAIRYLRSELKNREIELRRELEDEDVIEVLSRVAKRHRESVTQFRDGGRGDLAEREERQLAVTEGYLPEKLGEGELADLIGRTIEEVGAGGPGDLGAVMKALMPKVKGRADGGVVRGMVHSSLEALAGS